MRAAVTLALLGAASGFDHRIARPISSMAVGSPTNDTLTSLTSFMNMALDIEKSAFVLKGANPRFPVGGLYVTTQLDVSVVEGHNAANFDNVNDIWPHSGGRAGDSNPARLIDNIEYVTYTRGSCFGEDGNATVPSHEATMCDFSHSVVGCKQPLCSMKVEVSTYQGLEMTSRTVPDVVEIMTSGGRNRHCAFGVNTSRDAAPDETDEGVTTWDPIGVLTDFSSDCAAGEFTEKGSLLNVVKIHKITDPISSATSKLSRWLRLEWTLNGGNGMPYFSFKNSTDLWEEGWPGDEEIGGVRFCNHATGVTPDYLECVTQEFSDTFVRGTVDNGDTTTEQQNADNPTRNYFFAQQGATTDTGKLIGDFRLDAGDYIILPSFITYSGRSS